MARTNNQLMNVPGPAPSPLFGWRRPLAAFRRDPVLYLRHLHQQYGDVVAIAHAPSPVVAVSGDAFVDVLAQPQRVQSLMLPVTPAATLTQALGHACHDHTLYAAQQVVSRWGVGQLVDVVYVARRIVLHGILASFFGADLAQERAQVLGGWLHSWLRDEVAAPHQVGRAGQQDGALKRTIPPKMYEGVASMLAGAPSALVEQLFAPEDMVAGSIALVALVHEMTALAIGWTVFLLGQHMGVADDLAAELRVVLGSTPPTLDQLQGAEPLVLLDGVVRESLRMLPPLAAGTLVTRTAWQHAPVQLPAGTTIVYSPYLLQRAPHFFFAPDRFRPQRWTQIEPAPSAFLPLGVLPLADLVLPLVIAHTKLVVALLAQHYQLVPAAGMPVNRARSLLLAPHDDIPMVITPTDRAGSRRSMHGTIRDLVHLP
jgi:cytochrome P450